MEFEVAKVNSNKCTHDNSINVIIPEELQYEQILFRKYSTTMVNGTIMNMDNNSYDPLVENAQLTMFCETRSERSVEIKSGIIELFSRFKTLETNLLASSYDDLDEELTAWLQNTKMIAPIIERFQELYDHVYELDKN
ncbi:unnamed protein product [Rotaria magnacalcarata]|uniref:Uncharacterized protein n=1 Tax=Rotaria magnacalcarata TaxID=392030 RepID=A0A816NER8_9BILA|nr:unnamed protein product [Rotaria magnacalcarata]